MDLQMFTVLLVSLLLPAASSQSPGQVTAKPNATNTVNVCDILNVHCQCTSRGDNPNITCQFSAELPNYSQTLLQAGDLKSRSKAPSTPLTGERKVPSTQLSGRHSVVKSGKYIIDKLDISNSDLSCLSDKFLEGVSHIQTLAAENCQLTQVPKALLTIRHVRDFDLSQNNLTEFSLDMHTPLAVRKLILDSNRIETLTLTGDPPKRLAILNAGSNKLKDLPIALWLNLRAVYITHNKFADLPNLPAKSQIKILDISDNYLTKFPINILTATPSLQTLKLARNRIHMPSQPLTESHTKLCTPRHSNGSCVPAQMNLPRLQHFDLSSNSIRHMTPGLLANVPRLLDLDLSNNNLTSLWHDHDIFPQHSSRLHSLNLSHNALAHLHPDTFLHLQRLRDLDLSHNPKLSPGVSHVKFPEHLTRLDLSHCGMEYVDYCQLSSLHDLTYLNLTHNKLNCSCDLHKLYTWYRSSDQARQAGSEIPGNWQCLMDKSDTFVSVATQSCPDEIQCLSADPIPAMHDVNVNVNVFLAEQHLIASWTMPDVPSQIHGFRVLYSHKHFADGDNMVTAEHVSPILGVGLRSYTVSDIDHEKSYTVCLDMLANATSILKRVCKTVNANLPNVIVGILAGITFLIPCIVFVVYIYFKDKSVLFKELHAEEGDHMLQLRSKRKSESTAEEEKHTHTPLLPTPSQQRSRAGTKVCDFPPEEVLDTVRAFPTPTTITTANEMLGISTDVDTDPQDISYATMTELSSQDTNMADSFHLPQSSGNRSGQLETMPDAYFTQTSKDQFIPFMLTPPSIQGATNRYNSESMGERDARVNTGSTTTEGGTDYQNVAALSNTDDPTSTFNYADSKIPTSGNTNEVSLPRVRQEGSQGPHDPVNELDELVAELQALIDNDMK